jgi:outer membrane receptor for ferrienterochelin and colicin
MILRTLLPILFSLTVLTTANAVTLSGHIVDANTGETLINASVFDRTSGKGTVTNPYGFYSLTLPGPTMLVRFSYVGYSQQTIPLTLTKDTVVNIRLVPSTELSEVTVWGGDHKETGVKGSQMSTVQIPASQIKAIPTLFGEADLIKALQLLPGVQAGTEGSAGMYVRGGGPDENLLLLDGVPVYNVNHLFGFFSVFNTDAIKNVTLYKGSFPARFGSRLSSVVDIRMNDGNDQSYHGNVSVGLIASRFNLEGPIIKGKTTFNVSLRRTYADILAQPVIKLAAASADEGLSRMSAGYYFYDFNAKLSHILSDRDRLYYSHYMGDDAIYAGFRTHYKEGGNLTEEGRMKMNWYWGNLISALRWNRVITNKLFMNTTASFTRYRFDLGIGNHFEQEQRNPPAYFKEDQTVGYMSGITDYTAKVDFDYLPTPDHDIKFGASYTNHTFRPGVSVAKMSSTDTTAFNLDTIIGDKNVRSHEFQAYVEDNMSLGDLVKANIGLHYSTFTVQQTFYHSLQPRLGLRFLISDKLSAKLGYATMSQYIHLLSNSSVSLPTDLWVPVTKRIKPMSSRQVSAGLFYNLLDEIDLSLEAYYKTMDNLIEYKDGASFMGSSTGWEDKVNMGRGWAYGIEFLAQRSFGKTTGWLGYTWAKSERLFDRPGQEINGGRVFPAKYDRRHDVSLTVTHNLSERIDISGTWVYSSGNCGTLAMQEYDGLDIPDAQGWYSNNGHINSRNNYRFNPYHRLDLGINFHKQKKHGIRTWSISVYNAYNNLNPFLVYPNSDYLYDRINNRYVEVKKLTQLSIFPIIPSLSYSYKF